MSVEPHSSDPASIARLDPMRLLQPRRSIVGMSAILLPFAEASRNGFEVDWPGFVAHLARTADAGLVPAVNMDTGYVQLLDDDTRLAVLRRTREVLSGKPFVAGACVIDEPGSPFDIDAYLRQIEMIAAQGGRPVIFPSYGLTQLGDDELLDAYAELGRRGGEFYTFELGTMFVPCGRIYSLDVYRQFMAIPQCLGVKHSSLCREFEWQRLRLRDAVRPDFLVLSGNDLAIDMVMYGSDYLLGLSTMAPDLFARRDAYWAAGDAAFYELNDALQYLGAFTFRAPTPAYKHSAAMFLRLRGWISNSATHPLSPTRPDSDLAVLREIARRLDIPTRD